VVAEPSRNDRVVHDRFVRLVFEVAVPARAELGARPAIHHRQLFFGRTDLDTGFDTVRGERTCSLNVTAWLDL
jgi:hypothetical protein